MDVSTGTASWPAHREALGLVRPAVTADPAKLATAGTISGSVSARGLLADAVIVSEPAFRSPAAGKVSAEWRASQRPTAVSGIAGITVKETAGAFPEPEGTPMSPNCSFRPKPVAPHRRALLLLLALTAGASAAGDEAAAATCQGRALVQFEQAMPITSRRYAVNTDLAPLFVELWDQAQLLARQSCRTR